MINVVENNMINKINFEHPYLNNNVLPYLGNKKEELQFIDEIINKILKQYQKTKVNFKDFEKIDKDGVFTFVDLFSGSGMVSRYAKLKGFKVIANDLENYAKTITEVPIRYYKEQVNDYFENVCKKLSLTVDKKYEENKKYYLTVLDYLNGLNKVKYTKNNYFTHNFSSKENKSKTERLFFTYENAQKIDAIIEAIFNNKVFGKETREIVLSSLFVSMLNVINNEHYLTRSYLSSLGKGKIKERVLSNLTLEPFLFLSKQELNQINKKLLTAEYLCEINKSQAEMVLSHIYDNERFNFVYLDPPYNQQQYSTNYSLLISACENDKQDIETIEESGKKFETRKDLNKSNFCSKLKKKGVKLAEVSLQKTFDSINADYILYSYVPNSVLTIPEIIHIFSNNGNNKITVEYKKNENLNDINKNNQQEDFHCIFIIEKDKRQFQEDIDLIIRQLKASSIMPENESLDFSINQKFIDIKRLTEENNGWSKIKNSLSGKYKIFNKSKFIFEVNQNLMILSNIDTDFSFDESQLIKKYLIEENEVNKILENLNSIVLPSFFMDKELNIKQKNENNLPILENVENIKEEKVNKNNFDTIPVFEISDQKEDKKRSYDTLPLIKEEFCEEKKQTITTLDDLFFKAANQISSLENEEKLKLKNELLNMLK